MGKKLYQIWAGEGEILHLAAEVDTLSSARRAIKRELVNEQHNVILELHMENGEYMIVNPWRPGLPIRNPSPSPESLQDHLRKAGSIKSERKTKAARENSKRGGRPPKKEE